MNIYFDLNIFDRIEKKENLEENERNLYTKWENLVLSGQIVVPYSNAHLNDLFRGFQKNPNYIGTNNDPYFEELETNMIWELKVPLRKFKYIQVKLKNIILKINEFDKRRLEGNPVKNRSELNLSNTLQGFGHKQLIKPRNISENKINFQHKIIFIFAFVISILFLLSLLFFYRP